jgi:hypothetical protein
MTKLYRYFDVQIDAPRPLARTTARFKRNRITRALFIFQSNCAPSGHNTWNEPGYGYGRWLRIN